MRCEVKTLDERLRNPEYSPSYATARAAAIDLRACTVHDPVQGVSRMEHNLPGCCQSFALRPGDRVKFGTGVAVHLDSLVCAEAEMDDPLTFAGMCLPRSGLGAQGIVISNLVGLIDPDYQGEICITMWNTGTEAFIVKPLDRLCQMVIVPVIRPEFVRVDEFSGATQRGAGGFGSTGR